MLINDVLYNTEKDSSLISAVKDCSDFIDESAGLPLFKSLPSHYSDIHKVKVRFRKKRSNFTETFNQAFTEEVANLRQRAIFASSNPENVSLNEGDELFYVLPINGFKYLYNKEVINSGIDYQHAFDTILEQFEDDKEATTMITDLLKYTYTSENLHEGIQHGSEIILYNVPYYFAIRESSFPDYSDLLTSIQV